MIHTHALQTLRISEEPPQSVAKGNALELHHDEEPQQNTENKTNWPSNSLVFVVAPSAALSDASSRRRRARRGGKTHK